MRQATESAVPSLIDKACLEVAGTTTQNKSLKNKEATVPLTLMTGGDVPTKQYHFHFFCPEISFENRGDVLECASHAREVSCQCRNPIPLDILFTENKKRQSSTERSVNFIYRTLSSYVRLNVISIPQIGAPR